MCVRTTRPDDGSVFTARIMTARNEASSTDSRWALPNPLPNFLMRVPLQEEAFQPPCHTRLRKELELLHIFRVTLTCTSTNYCHIEPDNTRSIIPNVLENVTKVLWFRPDWAGQSKRDYSIILGRSTERRLVRPKSPNPDRDPRLLLRSRSKEGLLDLVMSTLEAERFPGPKSG